MSIATNLIGNRRVTAGAVAVRVVDGRRSYMLVGSASGRAEWLLPKGGLESGETPEAAAIRELGEEAGVRGALVCPIGTSEFAGAAGTTETTWFLATYVGTVTPQESRAACWMPFPAAREALSFREAKDVLDVAENLASKLWPDSPGPEPLYVSTLQSQLQFLNARMLEASDTANKFLTRFVFGGMVAVVALLNADLVMFKERPKLGSAASLGVALGAGVLVMLLSYIYFRTVERHYSEHRLSHRKLKYKFELTLYALLTPSTAEAYALMMEGSLEANGTGDKPPAVFGFATMAPYLKNHHQKRFVELKRSGSGYTGIAMLLVLITIVVRASGLLLQSPSEPAELRVHLLK